MDETSWQQNGYLVIPNHVEDANLEEIPVFTTKNQTGDEYFLDSARKIRCFLEEDAVKQPQLLQTTAKCRLMNKIGHALHDLDPVFRSFSRSPSIKDWALRLGWKKPIPVQSMFIFKQPFIGGEVRPHQDSSFLYTVPPTCIGFWWALEDTTKDNGCLWVYPGSHQSCIHKRMCRKPDGRGVYFKEENRQLEYDFHNFNNYIPLECTAGTLVILHGGRMRYLHSTEYVKVPEGVVVEVRSRRIRVKGPRGTLVKDLSHLNLEITKEARGKRVRVTVWQGSKNDLACLNTVCTHIKNMITGVTKGYRYKMRFVYAHFPINVSISDSGDSLEIRNFLGEKRTRKVNMLKGVAVSRSESVKDEIVLIGNDIEQVAQSAANIHQSCLVKNKDIRKFLDGIYVSEKGPIPEYE
eukprot:jgi/Galph1/588/GphlegSOOS_G5343.1